MTRTADTFTTPEPISATLQVAGARVRVTASDRTDTTVLVEPIDPSRRSDVRVADRTEVDFADGRLSVETKVSGERKGSVAITIDLPTGSGLVTHLAHSQVHAAGALGACELHVSSGRVELDRIDTLRADLADGEVAIGHVAGGVDVDGSVATVRIGEVDGAVRLSTSGGRTWIGHARAGLELGTARGDVDIDRADADVTATTADGAIRIGRLTDGTARLTNASGNIEIGIGGGTAAAVDAHSEKGAVHDFVSSQAHPEPADHKAMVHARTRHGDIIVQRSPMERN